MTRKNVFCSCLLFVMTACSDGGKLPPLRPEGNISGQVAAGEFSQGGVTAYSIQSGRRGERLGGAPLSNDGTFTVALRTASQPVLIELSQGIYSEEATGVEVTVPESQGFSAVVWYASGESSHTTVTPLSHIVAGLALYRIAHGNPAQEAVTAAQQEVSAAFNVNVATASPHVVTRSEGSPTEVDDAVRYGFYLAAISSLSEWIGTQNGVAPHQTYTSAALSQVMFNDVNADGVLDGVGWTPDKTGMMNLALGSVSLDANFYRMALAQHLLAMARSASNKTGLGFGALLNTAQQFTSGAPELFGGKALIAPTETAPKIFPAQVTPQNAVLTGIVNYKVSIDGVIPPEKVTFTLDDNALGDAVDPESPEIVINTTTFAEGSHVLRISAVDALGNAGTQEIGLNFDNFFVTVTSPLLTNLATYTLRGGYDLNGATLSSLTVQGASAVIDGPDQWHAAVNLVPGHNTVAIALVDALGHSEQYQFTVDLDQTLPVIDTSAGHSAAKFSSGDGNYTAGVLADENAGAPLFQLADRAELSGTPPTRTDLDANGTPYFAFKVSDPSISDIATAPENIDVSMTYQRNGVAVAPARKLTQSGGEFLVPIASETLDPAWLNSSPSDLQQVHIEARDAAGNVQHVDLTFRVDFYITPPPLDPVADLGDELFAATPFTQRSALNNLQFATTAYGFLNDSGKSISIYLADGSSHLATSLFEKMVREHLVQTKTTTEWRLGQISNALITNQCPQYSAWQTVTSVLNYSKANGWETRTVPVPTYGTATAIYSDTVPAAQPAFTNWANAPEFDGDYFSKTEILPTGTLTFEYDYILDAAQYSLPAAIRKWKVVYNSDPTEPKTCPDVDFFQQRFLYANESVSGYPKNTETDQTEKLNFSTTGFEVMDDFSGALIESTGGWYRIPAGHHVTIRKRVTTPALTSHNDTDVADPVTFSSYTAHYYDKVYSWTVNRNVIISFAHDAGSANLLKMSARNVDVSAGTHVYSVQR